MLIEINDKDADTVRAILLTHAEMQDMRAVQNEELRGRLSQDKDAADTVEDLEDIHATLDDDTQDLRRIAEIFEK